MEFNEEPLAFPQIEGYSTLRHLDEGSGSSVWLVEDDATHDELAVKILGKDAPENAAATEALDLDHEFLVEALGILQTSQGPGILMEYCPAGSAAQVVAVRGPLSVGETITVVAPIAGALAYLHAQGLTHGDLSPRNILFTAEGKPKLGDFGTHRVVGQLPGDLGTQGFCAPETFNGTESGQLEPARDVYALAACTWYLLTGRPPNATANRVPLGSMVPEVNDEFAKLLEQCLDQEPVKRPSAEQFGQRIFVAGEPLPVELSEAVEPGALKHMLTTRQEPAPAGLLGGRRNRGNPTAADRELLRERKAQIKAQQKPVPRRLRAAFGLDAAASPGADPGDGEWQWAQEHRVHGLKRGNRRVAVAVAAGVLLVAVAAGGAGLLRASGEPAAAEPVATSSPTGDPARQGKAESSGELMLVAAELAARRDEGLMSRNMELLGDVHVAGSPALDVDGRVVARMRGLGLHLEALETRLGDVEVLPGSTQGEAVLEAVSVQGGYRYVDDKGKTVVSAKKDDSQRVRMVLRFTEGSWRIWEVTAAG
ncbi:serine/threonine protein kinase [Paeniglutamicibacter psychrophenolicus]|uniref:serine/threonine protein kinase n=1 Tax=Paeniglutamicibacter psychrophenolicus TaxID=257454 RepID=UPI002782B92A|nr:serine/threonine-protein kinase [Paeniglutamicibacter psychrophenolicus]MDQ0094424.1 hypothetical protein [Paeniglutamicibacter psychrophenolicus]